MNEFSAKSLLLIGTGGVKRRAVFESMRRLGLGRITCVNEAPNWASPFVDAWIDADPVRPSGGALHAVAQHVASGARVDGVVTFDDYSVVLTAHLVEALGMIGTRPHAVSLTKHKASFRDFCRARGLPAPNACTLRPSSDIDNELTRAGVRFPVVVKPVEGAGSFFVRKVADRATLASVVEQQTRAIARADVAKLWTDRALLVEEYIDGSEVDIDMLVQGGRVVYAAVTDNFATTEPYFMEVGGQIPSTLPDDAQRALVENATSVLEALGVTDACVHFESKWTALGPVPIEVNLRIGGAEVHQFSRVAWGVDLVEGAVRIALGLPLRQTRVDRPTTLASINFIPTREGVLRSIDVEPGVHRSPWLQELVLFREPGERVELPPTGYDYLGWMIASGATACEARAHLDELARGVRFTIDSV